LRGSTYVTAVGADTLHKQELDPQILAGADLVVAASVSQCLERGELSHATREGLLDADDVTELGRIAADEAPGRTYEDQVTVADLTGLAVQDLQIATALRPRVHRSCGRLTHAG
jgi:ornithine cyclodeaminase/alanine dehydrogenase-like protein (mu-crystallin family)